MNDDRSIEALRGLAIILVVSLHITNDSQLESVSETYSYLAYIFENIRLPLFTVISGYLYGLRPVKGGQFGSFMKGKCRRILLPLFVVSILEVLSKNIMPGATPPLSIANVWKVPFIPYEHFWFLQVVFMIFIFVGILDLFNVMQRFSVFVGVFLAAVFLHVIKVPGLSDIEFFSLSGSTYLFPFFLLGYGATRFRKQLMESVVPYIFLLFFLVGFGLQNYAWFSGNLGLAGKGSFLGLIVACASSVVFLKWRQPVIGFAFVGTYAYTIFLYQGFGLGIGRLLFQFVDDVSPHFYFFSVTLIGVGFGVLVDVIVRKIPVLKRPMLGIK